MRRTSSATVKISGAEAGAAGLSTALRSGRDDRSWTGVGRLSKRDGVVVRLGRVRRRSARVGMSSGIFGEFTLCLFGVALMRERLYAGWEAGP